VKTQRVLKISKLGGLTRRDAEKMSKRLDLTEVDVVDCLAMFSCSHGFADELFMRIGHTAEIINASDFVRRIMEAGRCTARRDWVK
jgi:hypothetical protein